MNYLGSDAITLSRDVEVVAIPAGHSITLPKGTEVAITQALGGSYTLMVPTYGGLFQAGRQRRRCHRKRTPRSSRSAAPCRLKAKNSKRKSGSV